MQSWKSRAYAFTWMAMHSRSPTRNCPRRFHWIPPILTDGPHRLTILAQGESGREGVEEIPFVVHNGPGIIVSGLRPHSIRRGKVRFTVDAFSADDPFDPRRAEARSSIPGLGLGDVVVRYRLGGLVRRAHVGRPG